MKKMYSFNKRRLLNFFCARCDECGITQIRLLNKIKLEVVLHNLEYYAEVFFC